MMISGKDMKIFQQHKVTCLTKIDFSKKGCIDEPIEELINDINSTENYFTTSSCSGRIYCYEEPSKSVHKKGCQWLFVTHSTCCVSSVVESLTKSAADAFLKFEPFVLHVQCASIQDAQSVHGVAICTGFKNSGITIGKKGKIMANVRCPNSLEVPLTKNGIKLVSDEYIGYVVQLANCKMEENMKRIKRFHEGFNQVVRCQKTANTCATTNDQLLALGKHQSRDSRASTHSKKHLCDGNDENNDDCCNLTELFLNQRLES